MAFPGDVNSLGSVSGSQTLAAAGHATRHNEVKTALEGIRDALGGTAVPSGTVQPILAAGSASAPSLSFTGDSNTGLWSPAADTVAASTGGTERMRIDNAGLITGTGTSLGAWTAYTPTWVGFTDGNGTSNFAYTRVGKTVHVRGSFVLGSTSAMTGPLDISLPVAIGSGYNSVHPLGVAFYYDISAGVSGPLAPILVNSGARLLSIKTDGAYATQDETTATTPITWATGDYFYIHLTYETSA